MAGNQRRRAARTTNKKGMVVGSGGQRRKQLKGKGPTPRAEDRTGHPAARRAARADKASAARGGGAGRGGSGGRRAKGSTEVVAGRNSVLEALRTGVPGTALHVGTRMESDDRVKESIALATEAGIAVMESPRGELDRMTDGAVHQGLALTVPPYDYAHPDDLLAQQLPGTPRWWRSTGSPTRATWGRSSARPVPSARTGCSCRRGARPG